MDGWIHMMSKKDIDSLYDLLLDIRNEVVRTNNILKFMIKTNFNRAWLDKQEKVEFDEL